MESKNLPSLEKVEIATQQFNELLQGELPFDYAPHIWVNDLKNTGDLRGNLFEYVYRCHHHSYKAMHMKDIARHFVGMIIYLFSNKIEPDIIFFDEIGFLSVYNKFFKEGELPHIGLVFHKYSVSYSCLKKIISCKPKRGDGYQDWERHHLTLMGGVLYCYVCSISLLGMLPRLIKGAEKGDFITYPEGVANYILSDINLKGLNE